MLRFVSSPELGFAALVILAGCGRSSLPVEERSSVPKASGSAVGVGGAVSAVGVGGAGGMGGAGGSGGMGGSVLCVDGETKACGSNVGACKPGTETCEETMFGPCEGAVGPTPETCNGVDDNCDGNIDEGFGIGDACKGNGTDQCLDGLMTCDGCKKMGPDKVETCNGIDDNCNGIIDADCEVGDCKPSLFVTGSVPSSPNCIDFPVMAGSAGSIEYPCGGGPVTADLGGISFSGSVTNNHVELDGWAIVPPGQSPDGCTWQMHHHIEGTIPSGTVTYSYSEMVIVTPPGVMCWFPCTETGTVKINWLMSP